MFAQVHLIHKEDWWSSRAIIVTHTNSFSKQQEQEGMTSLSKRMSVTSLLYWLDVEDLTGDIIKEKD